MYVATKAFDILNIADTRLLHITPLHIANTCMAAARKVAGSMLSLSNMNPAVKEMQYAVRGPIVVRAAQLEKELKKVKSSSFRSTDCCTDFWRLKINFFMLVLKFNNISLNLLL